MGIGGAGRPRGTGRGNGGRRASACVVFGTYDQYILQGTGRRRKVTLLSFASREQCQVLLLSTTVHQLWTFFVGFLQMKS